MVVGVAIRLDKVLEELGFRLHDLPLPLLLIIFVYE
jgi:hypothetical protein